MDLFQIFSNRAIFRTLHHFQEVENPSEKKSEKLCKESHTRPTNGCKQLFFTKIRSDDERDHT